MNVKDQIKQLFLRETEMLQRTQHNGVSIFYGDIPDELRGKLRNKFQMSLDEEILFFRNVSWKSFDGKNIRKVADAVGATGLSVAKFATSALSGLSVATSLGTFAALALGDKGHLLVGFDQQEMILITTSGIRMSRSNQSTFLKWSDVEKFEYKDSKLYAIQYNGTKTLFDLSFFLKNTDQYTDAEQLAAVLTKLANLCDPQKVQQKIEALIKVFDLSEAERECHLYQETYGNDLRLRLMHAAIANGRGDFVKAEDEAERVIELIDKNEEKATTSLALKGDALAMIAEINLGQEKYGAARRRFFQSKALSSGVKEEDRHKKYLLANRLFNAHFLEQDYRYRRVLMPVDRVRNLDSKEIAVMEVNQMRNLLFSGGLPIVGQLYVAHPHRANKYFSFFDDYEIELLKDRFGEFCQLVQGLGATKISIRSEKDLSSSDRSDKQLGGTFDMKYGKIGGGASYDKSRENKRMDSLKNVLSLSQEFSPKRKPYIPEGLVWFPFEETWRKIATQRIEDQSLNKYTERMETNHSGNELLKSSDLGKLKVDYMLLSGKATFSREVEESFEKKENILLVIDVEFAPVDQLTE